MIKVKLNTVKIASTEEFFSYHGTYAANVRETLFVRAEGADRHFADTLLSAEQRIHSASLCRYRRIDALPGSISPDESRYYMAAADTLTLKAPSSHPEFASTLKNAAQQTLDIYKKGTAVTPSMCRNFTVKLLWLLDTAMGDMLKGWSPDMNAKITGAAVTRKSDVLFFLMLSLMGYDVLLLCPSQAVSVPGVDSRILHSFRAGEFAAVSLPPFREMPLPSAAAPKTFPQSPPSRGNPGEGNIRIKLPQRPGAPSRNTPPQSAPTAPAPAPSHPSSVSIHLPQRPFSPAASRPFRAKDVPPSAGLPQRERREKSSEELAALAASVVMIYCTNGEEVTGTGSGIMIGRQGFILTNHHVVCDDRAFVVRVENDDKPYFTREVIKYNNVLDLAVIRIDRQLDPLTIYDSPAPLRRGQRVIAIGSPMGMFNSVSDGIISGFRTTGDMEELIQFTAPTSPGSSGGAILNTCGEVIGICKGGIEDGQNLNLAVGYKDILPFVRGFLG